jgi:hypothetical protein
LVSNNALADAFYSDNIKGYLQSRPIAGFLLGAQLLMQQIEVVPRKEKGKLPPYEVKSH